MHCMQNLSLEDFYRDVFKVCFYVLWNISYNSDSQEGVSIKNKLLRCFRIAEVHLYSRFSKVIQTQG